MSIDTQILIINLFNREIQRSNHIATLSYLADVKAAKEDFIEYTKKIRSKNEKY